MIRKFFRKKSEGNRIKELMHRYKIPQKALATDRRSIANGLAYGAFIAFIPMPFQMLAVVALIPFMRINIPIAFTMVWLSNPVTMPLMYYMEYLTGSFFLNMSIENVEISLEWFQENFDDIFIPLYAGALFYSVTVSIVLYYVTNILWIRSVKKHRSKQDENLSVQLDTHE